MNVDENLLAKTGNESANEGEDDDSSAVRAGGLRESQRTETADNGEVSDNAVNGSPVGGEAGNNDEPKTIREAVAAQKRNQTQNQANNGDNAKSGAENAALSAAAAPVNMATSELLKQSWLNLVDSWGTSLIYINLHVFLRQIFGPKAFCKLGDEWGGAMGGAATKAVEGDSKKSSPKGIGEAAGLAACDGCCLIVILMVMVVVVIIYKGLSEPTTAASLLGEGLWNLISSVFK